MQYKCILQQLKDDLWELRKHFKARNYQYVALNRDLFHFNYFIHACVLTIFDFNDIYQINNIKLRIKIV
jgi:hypothetical protein